MDAKYYNITLNDKVLKDQPGVEDICKQYLYHLAFVPFIKAHNLKVINAFVFPTDEDVSSVLGTVEMPIFDHIEEPVLPPIKVVKLAVKRILENYISASSLQLKEEVPKLFEDTTVLELKLNMWMMERVRQEGQGDIPLRKRFVETLDLDSRRLWLLKFKYPEGLARANSLEPIEKVDENAEAITMRIQPHWKDKKAYELPEAECLLGETLLASMRNCIEQLHDKCKIYYIGDVKPPEGCIDISEDVKEGIKQFRKDTDRRVLVVCGIKAFFHPWIRYLRKVGGHEGLESNWTKVTDNDNYEFLKSYNEVDALNGDRQLVAHWARIPKERKKLWDDVEKKAVSENRCLSRLCGNYGKAPILVFDVNGHYAWEDFRPWELPYAFDYAQILYHPDEMEAFEKEIGQKLKLL